MRVLLDGGHLVLMGEIGMERIADFQLDEPSGSVLAGMLVLNGFPKVSEALINGKLARAALYGARGELIGSGLTVGMDSESDIVVNTVNVEAGNLIKIDAAELRHA